MRSQLWTRVAVAVISICVVLSAWADSPITSTPFSDAYMDYRAVRVAQKSGVMTAQLAEYLRKPSTPIDVKAAVINALSWNIDGKKNADLYCAMVYRKDWSELDMEKLRGDELMVIGYLLVMDDYFHPDRALPYVRAAFAKMPESYTVGMVAALVECQAAFDESWGDLWRRIEEVTEDMTLNGDMRLGANRIIVDYMIGYKEYE